MQDHIRSNEGHARNSPDDSARPGPHRVVRLTPPGRSAVATLRVEGPEAPGVVGRRFRARTGRRLEQLPANRVVLGTIQLDGGGSEQVIVRRGSRDSVEIHCHGGHVAVAAVEKALVAEGCRPVSWQDWVAGQEPDPIAAAARVALAEARTERTALVLLDQYHGALRRALDGIARHVAQRQGESARAAVARLLARADLGRHLARPWQVVLAGAPNVGKSSLMNAVVGYQRAIVHPSAGTTRDRVTATTAVDGWPIQMTDTAGLGSPADAVERAGIELAHATLQAADLVILVFDRSRPWAPADQDLADRIPQSLVVHNKADLPWAPDPARPAGLLTSAVRGDGINALVAEIARRLVPDPPDPGDPVPFTEDQIRDLSRLEAALQKAGEEPLDLSEFRWLFS